ncbi:chemotaxis protein CheX [Oligoflexus tunisiensis]|uniref:chemotaxis protein CheX n=1 Tax=Oligoflexus tunisiensis TaxID=708132 RepID=UPI000ABDF74E|nr:chemotaxis protein CheX [Oligoflexus tunisiensis]
MHCLLLLRPSAGLQKTIDEVVRKFSGIHEVKVDVDVARTAIEFAKCVDQGRRYGAVIIETEIEEVEVNYILNLYHDLKRKPPLLLCKANYEKLVKRLTSTQITPVIKDFNKDFIYDYLKETLIIAEKKIDIRIIKEVLLSVTGIIHENTQVKLEALGLSEIKAKDSKQEMSSIIAFIGDGVMGTLSIATTNNLISLFCQKMLYCDAADVTATMRADVLNELSNQILGAFRNKLAQDGYELSTSMQIVVSGEKDHLFQTKTNGHYYYLKFKHADDDFLITFAYGSYKKQKGEANFTRANLGGRTLDVRIVNLVLKALGDVINLNGERPHKVAVAEQRGQDYQGESLHILHGRGHQGSFIVALDIPRTTVGLITQETMGIATADLSPDMINDVCGELINQIAGSIKKYLGPMGFDYLNVFHGSFCTENEISYLLKNQGLYCRMSLTLRSQPFVLCFGLEAAQGSKVYDIWSYIKSLGQVAKAVGKGKTAS